MAPASSWEFARIHAMDRGRHPLLVIVANSWHTYRIEVYLRLNENALYLTVPQGQQQDVGSMQKIVATCKSCLFRFTNGAYTSETLCDSDWVCDLLWSFYVD